MSIKEPKEREKLYNKNYYQAHKENKQEYNSLYYQIRGKEQGRKSQRKRRAEVKKEILIHYGGGKCACVECGESRLACLSIDHINGKGNEHRRKLKTKAGYYFYRWLKQNNYPFGYQTLCMNCQFIKRDKELTRKNTTRER